VTRAGTLLGLLALASGCVTNEPSPTAGKISSLELKLLDPPANMLGSEMNPVDAQQVTVDIIAKDDQNQQMPIDVNVEVYISFGGVKSGDTAGCDFSKIIRPITTVKLTAGALRNHVIKLPRAFGPSTVWLDDPVSHASGASPTIFFRHPRIPDVTTPPDIAAANATFCTPFNRKFVQITEGSNGGKLVVSSVFDNAFSVTDTGVSTFNSIYVFSFGRPPSYIVRGRVLSEITGNLSKFIGFTELNFPLFRGTQEINPNILPPPVTLMAADINIIPKILGQVASEVTWTGLICDPLAPSAIEQWLKFNTLIADQAGTCDAFSNLSVELPAKAVGNFDPLQHIGKSVKFTGMLRNSSGQNPVTDVNGNMVACSTASPCVTGTCVENFCRKGAFNFWTVNVRGSSDIVVQ
jgi:hypothetical protein